MFDMVAVRNLGTGPVQHSIAVLDDTEESYQHIER